MSLLGDASAVLSPCRTWRYSLTRTVTDRADLGGPRSVTFVGLNPSTADETVDDPTIRRCVGFARRFGYGSLAVANLFSLRATNPRALYTHTDPVGPETDATIRALVHGAGVVVAAWGAHGALHDRGAAVARLVAETATLWCLGATVEGHPVLEQQFRSRSLRRARPGRVVSDVHLRVALSLKEKERSWIS